MAKPRKKNLYEVVVFHRPRTARITTDPETGNDEKVVREDPGQVILGPENFEAFSIDAAKIMAARKIKEEYASDPDELEIRVRQFRGDEPWRYYTDCDESWEN